MPSHSAWYFLLTQMGSFLAAFSPWKINKSYMEPCRVIKEPGNTQECCVSWGKPEMRMVWCVFMTDLSNFLCTQIRSFVSFKNWVYRSDTSLYIVHNFSDCDTTKRQDHSQHLVNDIIFGKIWYKITAQIFLSFCKNWNSTTPHYTFSIIGRLPAIDAFCVWGIVND